MIENLLTAEEIRNKLIAFNKGPRKNDRTLFDDVPEIQQVNFLYPFVFNIEEFIAKTK